MDDLNGCLNMAGYAQQALEESDRVLLRCYENGISVPVEWVKYRQELRIYLFGDKPGPIPTKPKYPENT